VVSLIFKKGRLLKNLTRPFFTGEKCYRPGGNDGIWLSCYSGVGSKTCKTIALNEVKDKISAFLEQQKRNKAFADIMKKLQQNAKIEIY